MCDFVRVLGASYRCRPSATPLGSHFLRWWNVAIAICAERKFSSYEAATLPTSSWFGHRVHHTDWRRRKAKLPMPTLTSARTSAEGELLERLDSSNQL